MKQNLDGQAGLEEEALLDCNCTTSLCGMFQDIETRKESQLVDNETCKTGDFEMWDTNPNTLDVSTR